MTGPLAPQILANASCVAIGGRGVLILGEPGSGKSSLALALIDRGAVLVGDDGVTLDLVGGRVIASPPPHIAGLAEVRNVGLIRLPTTSAPLAIALRLTRETRRHPEEADRLPLLGTAIPLVALWPESHVLHLRAEHALALYGLPLPFSA
jgi:serine kinase of HPr protein (carbohydrate metabolism regulator)